MLGPMRILDGVLLCAALSSVPVGLAGCGDEPTSQTGGSTGALRTPAPAESVQAKAATWIVYTLPG